MQSKAVPEHVTPDMSNFRTAHAAIRRSNQMLVDGIATALGDSRRVAAIQKWYARYAGELRTHHRNEDEIYFPALASKVPTFGEYEQSLADDHAQLHHLIDQLDETLTTWPQRPSDPVVRDQAQVLAVDLRDLMLDHLEVEDRDILPLFERHITAAELDALDARMLKALEFKQALFTVPWMLDSINDVQRQQIWELATPQLKLIYRLTARRYRRLTAAAFGAGS